MRYRVDELAGKAGLSVDTVRYYQAQGLLDQPERDGRVAYYSEAHRERLQRILDLKQQGFTLGAIRRLFAGELDPADAALVAAVAGSGRSDGPAETLTLDELAERTGISPALLQAIQGEGLLPGRSADGEPGYSEADVGVVKAGLALLEAGLPVSELLALAREHDAAVRRTAERAVDMFLRFVRDPIRAKEDEAAAAEEVVAAFRKMLPATTSLVAEHFRGVLMAEAEKRISGEAMEGELEAVRESASR